MPAGLQLDGEFAAATSTEAGALSRLEGSQPQLEAFPAYPATQHGAAAPAAAVSQEIPAPGGRIVAQADSRRHDPDDSTAGSSTQPSGVPQSAERSKGSVASESLRSIRSGVSQPSGTGGPRPPQALHSQAATIPAIAGIDAPRTRQASVTPPSSSTQSQRAAPDTFTALDTPSAMPPAVWLHTGSRHAEAGYLDPSLGWIGVRADSTGSAVHAAIVTGSTEAARALDVHLPGINSYVVEHHGEASTVTLASEERHTSSSVFSGSGNGAAHQHSEHAHPQSNAASAAASINARNPARAARSNHSASGTTYIRAGAHISVVA